MEQGDFVRTLLPAGSITISAGRGKSPNKVWLNEQFTGLSEALERARELNQNGFDVYLQTAVYGTALTEKGQVSKKDDNVKGSSNLDLDVDVGPAKYYKTLEEAWDAIQQMLKDAGLPQPTIILMSGHGFRLIWHLTETLLPPAWKMEAEQLARCARANGLVLDDDSSKDIKRGVRLPDMLNYKNPAAPVTVEVKSTGPTYTIEDIRKHTMPEDEEGLRRFVDPEDIRQESYTERRILRYTIANIGRRCAVLNEALKTKGEFDNEPDWVKMLQLLACAEDGREWIHEVSSGHAMYSEAETEEKFRQRFNEDGTTKAGPTSCRRFGSPLCDDCIFRDRIKTPAQLGKIVATQLPPGYVSDSRGTRYEYPDGEGGIKSEFLTYTQFLDGGIKTREADKEGETGEKEMHFAAITPGDEYVQIIIPTADISSDTTLRRKLSGFGITAVGGAKGITRFMSSWLDHLQHARNTADTIEHLGWVRSTSPVMPDKFALPSVVFANGRDVPYIEPRIPPALAALYGTAGTLEGWQQGAQAVIDHGSPALTVGIIASFAAPLIRFTNVSGGILSLSSGASGTGKTTALMAGMGVWGDPHAAIHMADDTSNSVLKRIGMTPNFPVYWDEIITHYTPEVAREVVTNLFRLAQGREKSRMSAKRELVAGLSWQTMVILASNFNVMDVVRNIKNQAGANQARIIELDVRPIDTTTADTNCVLHNYGHAGYVYGRWLSQHSRKLMLDIPKLQERVQQKDYGGVPEARFWSAMTACILYAAKVVSNLNLLNVDYQLVHQSIKDATKRQQLHHCMNDVMDTPDILMEYLSSCRESVAVFRYQNGFDMSAGVIYNQQIMPGQQINAIYYVSKRRLFVATKPFRRWLTNKSHNTSEIIEEIMKVPGCRHARTVFGALSPYPSGRQMCLEIDVTAPPFKDVGAMNLGGVK